jgi:lipoprotein-anchoring transpeptidase ErfK/SrfK
VQTTRPPTAAPPGWATYTNADYGFSFHYPTSWAVQEIPSDGTRANVVRLRWEMLRVVVQYRRTKEDTVIEKTAPGGNRQPRGTASFLGQDVTRDVLVDDGKVKQVAYRLSGGPAQAGDLVFSISLQSVASDECLREFELNCDYQAIDIPTGLQDQVDGIVASFELIPTSPPPLDEYPGWARYTRADYGFSFRYPPTWVLREGRNFVSLRHRTLRLIIGYREAAEEINICCRAELPPGDVVPAGTVRFLGQDLPRALLEHEGKVKAVLYNDADRITVGGRVFLLSLEDFAADYQAADIPQPLQAQVDRTIASLVTFEPTTALLTPTPIPTRLPPTRIPATETPVPATVEAGADGANVRGGPGTDYPRLGYLEPGTQVSVIGRYGDWWQIEYNGALAWVADRVVIARNTEHVPLVLLTATPGAGPPTPAGPIVEAGAHGANVRNGPGTDYARLGYLDPGAQTPVIGRYGDWWQIEYYGALAWVADQVVVAYNVRAVPEVQSPPTPVPSSPAVIPTPAPLSHIHETRWIDVDLAHQRVTAYEQQTPVYTTLASTGLPNTPTVVGQFRIWIKLRYDDMSGPGYYLEDVPYVMYFYQGYGFHGVWWHANFGYPMSHGCVNLPTEAAEWLFNWADVGTLVNVHN